MIEHVYKQIKANVHSSDTRLSQNLFEVVFEKKKLGCTRDMQRSLGQPRNCKVQLTLIALLTHLHWDQKHSKVGFKSLHTCYFKRNFLYFHQRVIRREPKVEWYVLTKVKSPPFVRSFYNNFQSFFDTYLNIFHKTEDQMVFLRC